MTVSVSAVRRKANSAIDKIGFGDMILLAIGGFMAWLYAPIVIGATVLGLTPLTTISPVGMIWLYCMTAIVPIAGVIMVTISRA